MRQLGEDMNQFAMGQVFCWSARVMCLGISPLPIQASRIGFASSPRVSILPGESGEKLLKKACTSLDEVSKTLPGKQDDNPMPHKHIKEDDANIIHGVY